MDCPYFLYKNAEISLLLLNSVERQGKAWYNANVMICCNYNCFEVNKMAASYKKLFKLLIDREMKKKDLAEAAGISIATITKMGKDGAVVSSDVLVKICTALGCTMDDIVEIVSDEN